MHIDIMGQTAVLVGSDGAIGDALADMLAEDGARVVRVASLEAPPHEDGCVAIFAPPLSVGEVSAACAMLGDAGWRGRILVIGTARGLVPARGFGESSVAGAGVLAAVRVAGMELASKGVAVNALAVGAIGAADETMVFHTAIRRAGTPAEAAAAALFLLDPANTYMTGQVLAVDGGWSAGFVRDF